ncbi:MAG: CDC27 family protein [Clostridia bacterium]|nr:CDC27 family protein [Clostridia bacterium]
MGLLTPIKANKAYRLQQKGQREEARKLYEEAYAEGLNDPRYNQAYALLMTRMGEYQKAKEFLVKHQKTPGMSQDQRVTMLVNYAACCFRLGNIDKGIDTLEQQFRKTETGLLYQTLGYLYIEKYDAANKPVFDETPVTEQASEEAAEETKAEGEENEAAEEKTLSPQEAWDAGVKKAEDFILKSLEYDDEDPISLDNMGQFIYRVKGDKEGAKAWFEKAIALKDKQIDTLYFLSRYDVEGGDKEAAIEKLEKAAGGNFSPLNYCSRETILKEIEKLKGAN